MGTMRLSEEKLMDIIHEMLHYLEALPKKERPVPLDNWAALAGVHRGTFEDRITHAHPWLADEYRKRRRDWREGVLAALFAVPYMRRDLYAPIAAEWFIDLEQAERIMRHGRDTGRYQPRPSKLRYDWRKVIACAKPGMTREDLARAAAVSVATIRDYFAAGNRRPGAVMLRAAIRWRDDLPRNVPGRIAEVRR